MASADGYFCCFYIIDMMHRAIVLGCCVREEANSEELLIGSVQFESFAQSE